MEYLFYAAMPYLVQMYSFLFINGYCRVTGLVFIIIDAYYIIDYWNVFEQAKGCLHWWDFETEEEWATYNEQKEAMPKAAFQFGVKMQDGRKTRKQKRDQKLNNELHQINKILTRKKMEKKMNCSEGGNHYEDDLQPVKKLQIWKFDSCSRSFLL